VSARIPRRCCNTRWSSHVRPLVLHSRCADRIFSFFAKDVSRDLYPCDQLLVRMSACHMPRVTRPCVYAQGVPTASDALVHGAAAILLFAKESCPRTEVQPIVSALQLVLGKAFGFSGVIAAPCTETFGWRLLWC
jgi:hypothetical protein